MQDTTVTDPTMNNQFHKPEEVVKFSTVTSFFHSGQQRAYFYKFNNECIISSRIDCKQLFNNGIVNLIICLKI